MQQAKSFSIIKQSMSILIRSHLLQRQYCMPKEMHSLRQKLKTALPPEMGLIDTTLGSLVKKGRINSKVNGRIGQTYESTTSRICTAGIIQYTWPEPSQKPKNKVIFTISYPSTLQTSLSIDLGSDNVYYRSLFFIKTIAIIDQMLRNM
jgi:hypothetical protein